MMQRMMTHFTDMACKTWKVGLWCMASCLLGACTSVPSPQAVTPAESGAAQLADANHTPTVWQHWPLPGKRSSVYTPVEYEGRWAWAVRADASASLLRQSVHIAPEALGTLRFSWRVPALIAQADMAQSAHEDAPVRVVLAFDGDRSRLSLKQQMLSELAQALTGEPLPYATLMYVWCNRREPGSVIINPRSDRIRKLVLESGPQRLNQWLDYERDIRADYTRLFGEPPGNLIGIAFMTDTDNTGTQAQAWYGPVTHRPAVVASGGSP